MLTIGVDPHKRTHSACLVDACGRFQSLLSIPNQPESFGKLLQWAQAIGTPVQWAIENCGGYGRELADYLVTNGQSVYDVAPYMVTKRRLRSRAKQKHDQNDAMAVARVLLQEEQTLPLWQSNEAIRELAVWLEHRRNLVDERTRKYNQLHAHLSHLIPCYEFSLTTKKGLKACQQELLAVSPSARKQVAQQLLQSVIRLSQEIEQLKELLKEAVKQILPDGLEISGAGCLTTAQILVEVRTIERFKSESHLASFAGVSPRACDSGHGDNRPKNYRLNRGGNRRLNQAVYIIALTQIRNYRPAQEYYEAKQKSGKTKKAALRCLKRYLVRQIYNSLRRHQLNTIDCKLEKSAN